MNHALWATPFIFAAASAAAAAQDGLTPTDVLETGQLSVSARLQFAKGQGDVSSQTATVDADLTQFDATFQGAVGLIMGLEVEVSIPYQFVGDTKLDGTNFSQEFEEVGFGDLTVSPIYRILKDGADGPQLIIGAIFVAPTGKTEPAEPETQIGPLTVDGEKGGIGDAIWRYGAIAGISKRLTMVEPYLTVAWLSGGDAEVQSDSIEIERPDLWTVTLGAEFHVAPLIALDVRGSAQITGEEKTTDATGAESKEEAHYTLSGQAQLYFTAGSGVTLIVGVGVALLEDHEIDDTPPADLEDTFVWGAHIGIHINLGR